MLSISIVSRAELQAWIQLDWFVTLLLDYLPNLAPTVPRSHTARLLAKLLQLEVRLHDFRQAWCVDQCTFVWHCDVTLVCRQPLFVLFKHFAKIDIDPCVFLRWLRVQLARQALDHSVLFCLVLARRGLAIHRRQVHLIQRICGDIPIKVLVVLLGQAIHYLTTALRPGQLHVVVLFGLFNRLIFIETLSLLIL